MKKKLLSVLLSTVLLAGILSACSVGENAGNNESTNPTETTTSKQAKEPELTKVTLNEVAHSIFYAPQYVAIEEGYFEEEGINLTVVTGFGADKVMTAVLSGEADIGFMGSESSIYTYQEGANDVIVNFAQLTQRAGNFLVARKEMKNFSWDDLKGKTVLGGRKGIIHYIM